MRPINKSLASLSIPDNICSTKITCDSFRSEQSDDTRSCDLKAGMHN